MLMGGLLLFCVCISISVIGRKPEATLPYLLLGIGGVACGVTLLGLALRAYLFP